MFTLRKPFRWYFLLLIVAVAIFCVSNVSDTHAAPAQSKAIPTTTISATFFGSSQHLKAFLGHEVVVARKNGWSIVVNTRYTSNQKGVRPNNGSIPGGGCGYAGGMVQMRDILGIVIMQYELSDFFCNNVVAITYQAAPTDGWATIPGITLVSHSTSNGWIQKPWSAYAVGNYDFLTGIPTPWGGIGSNCGGNITIHMVGDGPYFDFYDGCR